MTPTRVTVARGEVWEVRFDPSEGDEIRKVRPAVVMDVVAAGRMQLHIVVPITGWQPHFKNYFWMVRLAPTAANGLNKDSAADAFQVKSVSTNRFIRSLGALTNFEIHALASAIA